MRRKLGTLLGTAAMAGALALAPAAGQTDNTKANKHEQPTADQAKNTTSDRGLMQKIRQSVESDSTLSTNAHNVKIIARNGKVTLKGVVRSEAEKQAIEARATEAAGAGNVVNDVTVKPEKANRAEKTPK